MGDFSLSGEDGSYYNVSIKSQCPHRNCWSERERERAIEEEEEEEEEEREREGGGGRERDSLKECHKEMVDGSGWTSDFKGIMCGIRISCCEFLTKSSKFAQPGLGAPLLSKLPRSKLQTQRVQLGKAGSVSQFWHFHPAKREGPLRQAERFVRLGLVFVELGFLGYMGLYRVM